MLIFFRNKRKEDRGVLNSEKEGEIQFLSLSTKYIVLK